jgi:hydrogenase maturation protease
VGIGSVHGDDAVGPAVARLLEGTPGVDVVERADPSSLVELLGGRDLVVVVDAMVSGAEPGGVRVFETSDIPRPVRFGGGGTHGIGVDEALELARLLDRLPSRVVVVGIEVSGIGTGTGLSPEARAATTRAARVVGEILGGGAGSDRARTV